NIWFALETSNEDTSLFSSEALENPTLLKAAGVAAIFAVIATELGILNRVLETVNLSAEQWEICIAISLVMIVIPEIKKFFKSRTTEIPPVVHVEPEAAPAAA